jgi:putative transcriptional regulator
VSKNYELVKARKAKKLTQEQLADLLDCKKTTISNWENGYSKPTLNDAYKVSQILETDMNILFFGDVVQESQTINNELSTS